MTAVTATVIGISVTTDTLLANRTTPTKAEDHSEKDASDIVKKLYVSMWAALLEAYCRMERALSRQCLDSPRPPAPGEQGVQGSKREIGSSFIYVFFISFSHLSYFPLPGLVVVQMYRIRTN